MKSFITTSQHSVIALAVLSLLSVHSAMAADRYWDTDSAAPLVGNGSVQNLSGSFFSTAAAGNTALTTFAGDDDLYFQTDTLQSYTGNVDSAQTMVSITVANGNDVTFQTSVNGNRIICSNAITVAGGSSLTLKQISNTLILDAAERTDITLGAGDNTFTIDGSSGSGQFWFGDLTGDAGDTVVFNAGGSWIRSSGSSVFGGELIGSPRLSPGTMTLTGDNPNFGGNLEGGTIILGNGGTSGTIGSGRKTAAGTVRINRSDDYVFTNEIATAANNQNITIANDGTGSITVTSDVTVGALFITGNDGTIHGDTTVAARMWFSGTGTWTLTGTNTAGGIVYDDAVRTSSGTANIRLGDGSTFAKLDVTRNFRLASGSDLTMDLTGGAQLTTTSNLVAGTGRDLIIIGEGQIDPIIVIGETLTAFENVIYDSVSYTWVAAQVPKALGGSTQMRIVGNSIYIDPPPVGMLFMIQ